MSSYKQNQLHKIDEFESVDVLGVKIDILSVDELIQSIVETCLQKRKLIIANVNVHAMNIALEEPWFKNFLNDADIVFCDGFGVKFGASILGIDIPYRYTPPDWFIPLSGLIEKYDLSMYFLGGREGVAHRAGEQLKSGATKLNIVGTHHGFFDKAPNSLENNSIVLDINAKKPNILVLGFGMPLQERWLLENWDNLDANIAITAGAIFDYLSGEIRRAPHQMTNYGFEWLGRLIIEPRRLWKRYLIGNPVFFWRIIKNRYGFSTYDKYS